MAVVQVQNNDVVIVPAEAGEITLRVVPIVHSEPEEVSLWIDLRDELPYNEKPDAASLLANRGGWWERSLDDIDGIAIHHTTTNNLEATAAWTARPKAEGGKGYPSLQYHFWVAADGEIFYCVDLGQGVWHDHCGDKNTHISVGMAGRLDVAPPPQAQLQATAWLVAHLCRQFALTVEQVNGHQEWAWKHSRVKTACPGWNKAHWRTEFSKELLIARSST